MDENWKQIEIEITYEDALHMRPGLMLASSIEDLKGDIRGWVLGNESSIADFKSIMQIVMLATVCGDTVFIEARGLDADIMLANVREIIENLNSEGHGYVNQQFQDRE